QMIVGVEARRRDLGAIEIGVALTCVEMPRRRECGARHLPAAEGESPELEVRNRCGVRRACIGAISLRDPLDGSLERGRRRGELAADRREFRAGSLAELGV